MRHSVATSLQPLASMSKRGKEMAAHLLGVYCLLERAGGGVLLLPLHLQGSPGSRLQSGKVRPREAECGPWTHKEMVERVAGALSTVSSALKGNSGPHHGPDRRWALPLLSRAGWGSGGPGLWKAGVRPSSSPGGHLQAQSVGGAQ